MAAARKKATRREVATNTAIAVATPDVAPSGTRLGRRGLMAAAAALAVGLTVRNSESVAATGGNTTGSALIIGAFGPDNTSIYSTKIVATASWSNANGAALFQTDGAASTVSGQGTVGLWGIGGAGGTGVIGNGAGVSSQANPSDFSANAGVLGRATPYPGVYGISGTFLGVKGETSGSSTSAIGVFGTTNGGSGSSGVYGQGNGAGTTGVSANGLGGTGVNGVGGTGVNGQSSSGIGVNGTTTTGYAVVGTAPAGAAAAIYGSSSGANTPAFAAYNGVAGGLAGAFSGKVYINGDFVVAGGAKSAAVPFPDGSHRLVYCVESPESWFEDFGKGTLAGGKAEMKLDPDFAAVVDTSTLHVFLTPHDESHHLAVKATNGGGFSVAASAVGDALTRGVKASDVSGTFTYRVVAKRKDIEGERLAKFEVPKVLPPPPVPAPPASGPKLPALPVMPKS